MAQRLRSVVRTRDPRDIDGRAPAPASVLVERRSRGRWALAGIESDAFAETPQVRSQLWLCRRKCLRVAMWLVLLVCERRVNEGATAVCLFTPVTRRGRIRAWGRLALLALAMVLVAAALALVWAAIVWLLALALLMLVTPSAWSGWRNRRAKAVLESYGSSLPAVYVHSVARLPGPGQKGDGATLMRALTAEADTKRWRLTLDAGAPALVEYYRRFGFEPIGEPVAMTWGSAVRMAREPKVQHG